MGDSSCFWGAPWPRSGLRASRGGCEGTWLWEQRAGTVALVSVAQFALVHSSPPAVAKENPQPGEGMEPGAAPKKRKKKKQRVKE